MPSSGLHECHMHGCTYIDAGKTFTHKYVFKESNQATPTQEGIRRKQLCFTHSFLRRSKNRKKEIFLYCKLVEVNIGN